MTPEPEKLLTLLVALALRQQGSALPTQGNQRARLSVDDTIFASMDFSLDEWRVDVDRDYRSGALTFTLRPVMGGFLPLMDERKLYGSPGRTEGEGTDNE